MLKQKKASSRERILRAATELALEVGPGHVSLDAVAQRAGLSKGGLLYSFPSKAKLLQAVVEDHLREHSEAMLQEERAHENTGNPVASAFFNVYKQQIDDNAVPASGVLAAIAEDPEFVAPIRRYNRELLTRMQEGADDNASLLVAFLAVQGLQCMKLFDCDFLDDAERQAVMHRLQALFTNQPKV